MEHTLDTPPDLVLTVVRPAFLEASHLGQWRPGRVNWTEMWSADVRTRGLNTHKARPAAGVAEALVGHVDDWQLTETTPEWIAEHDLTDLVVHRPLTHVDTSDTYFGQLGIRPFGMSFLRLRYAELDRTLPASTMQGWVVVHFTAMWPSTDEEVNLKHFQQAIDIANIPQPLNGNAEINIDCLQDLHEEFDKMGLNLNVNEHDRYNRVLVLARVPASKQETQAEESSSGSGPVRRYSEQLGKQQYLPAIRLESERAIGDLSFDYRAVVASSHRVVHAIPGSGDPNGVVSHFVDIYAAFLLACIQDVTLNNFAMQMQAREYLPRTDEGPEKRAKHWETLLQDQTSFYAFRSKFWWTQWARRGPGMHLLPRLQELWRTTPLAEQLGDEFRDYGNAASAELARLLIQQEQDVKARQRNWSVLAQIASIIIGGITLIGVWAGLAALGVAQRPTDGTGLTWSAALLVATIAILLFIADRISRASAVHGEDGDWQSSPWLLPGLLAASVATSCYVLIADPSPALGITLVVVSTALLVGAFIFLFRRRAATVKES